MTITTRCMPLRRCLSESKGLVQKQNERHRRKSLQFEPTFSIATKNKDTIWTKKTSINLPFNLMLAVICLVLEAVELRKCKLRNYFKRNKKNSFHKSTDQEAETISVKRLKLDISNQLEMADTEETFKKLNGYDPESTYFSPRKLFLFLYEDYFNCVNSMQRTIIKAFPLIDCSSSFEEYVQKELHSNQSLNPLNSSTPERNPHSMNMEIIRISTFDNFPQSSSVSTIKLAKEGFYYTGEGNRVACFACSVHRDGWKTDDDPREIHRRLSPNCPFLISCQSGNVPVREIENVTSNHADDQPSAENGGSTSEQVNQTGERNLLQISTLSMSNNEIRQRKNTRSPVPRNTTSNINQRGEEFNLTSSERHEVERPHQRSWVLQEKINVFLRSLDPLGIDFDRPKYPAYAVVATRLSSFKDWPSSITQTPRDLALAGFLYAGYGDYTRCFFCGGGLRNWEPGDDPWIEHARWFPKCAFLRQNKGDEFVALVQIEHNEMESSEAMNAEGAASNTCRNDIRLKETEEKNTEENTAASVIFNLVSVQSVLEMGYTRQAVKEAFDLLRVTKHTDDISGEDLIDAILSKEENSTRIDTQPATHIPESKVQERNDEGYTAETNKMEDKPSLDSYTDTKSLIEENRRLKDLRLCKICLENEASIAMLPCGHLCCCPDCAPAMRKCPICRQFVKGTNLFNVEHALGIESTEIHKLVCT